jgi:outer membrane protein TolC
MATTEQKYQIAEELFRAGAITSIELVAILARLEMDRREAERAAYAAEAEYYGSEK